MELETAVRRHLLADATVASLTSKQVWKYRLEERLDGTGKAAVVVRRDGGWSQPNELRPNEFPLLVVDCYADVSRDEYRNALMLDAEDRASALYRAVDRALLAPGRGQWWGGYGSDRGLMVNSVQRWGEPVFISQADQHSGAPLGDVVYMQARYGFDVVH